ncbi:peroxiredoxin family protein [Reichenbachiella versicolor]|uniref:peroxiredoxin family protein n=1 Tax=Reichenbachiella versicolor TaxID=1821036 RepID=UPI000D6E5673|nr:TlpA disulfide reductase family protein [Reichenbachiella versicolor]
MKYAYTIFFTLCLSLAAFALEKGEKAPDIILQDVNGKEVRLSSLKGQVVLLDFWASWCKPCRKENPMLVRMYNEYKDVEFENGKGFTIYSVSLDMKKEAWEKAIEKDGLVWDTHVSDLKGWKSAAAKTYSIRSIPQSYLLDGDGNIIAVNPRGERLEKELKKFKKSSSILGGIFRW